MELRAGVSRVCRILLGVVGLCGFVTGCTGFMGAFRAQGAERGLITGLSCANGPGGGR